MLRFRVLWILAAAGLLVVGVLIALLQNLPLGTHPDAAQKILIYAHPTATYRSDRVSTNAYSLQVLPAYVIRSYAPEFHYQFTIQYEAAFTGIPYELVVRILRRRNAPDPQDFDIQILKDNNPIPPLLLNKQVIRAVEELKQWLEEPADHA